MAEGGTGIMDRLRSAFGGTHKPETPLAPTTPPQSSEALKQMVEGKDGLPSPRDFRGPGISNADRIQMGEARATSPGATTLEETKKRLEAEAAAGVNQATPEATITQPEYIGPSKDDMPLASATNPEPEPPQAQSQETPPNVVQFPQPAEQSGEPAAKPLEVAS